MTTAHFDQLEAAYSQAWHAHELDLSGRADDELLALRSALLTLDVLDVRARACGSLAAAVEEAREVLERTMFPPHLGFLG